MNMRLDVVNAPIRYRRLPMFWLLIIAVVPAVGLVIGYRWLDDEADLYEAAREDVAEADVDARPRTEETDRFERLATPVFQFRRVASPVTDLANARLLRERLEPGFIFLNDTSCLSVAVNGVEIASHNPSTPVIPASTQKLITAAVALEVLGPEYRFQTQVLAPLPVDGVVDGDVYLVGGGDPVLSSDDVPTDDEVRTSLDRLADAFVASGIERVRGAVLGDGGRYDDEFVVEGWGPGVAGVEAGPYDALLVNDAIVLGRTGRQSDPNAAGARELERLLESRDIRVDNGSASGAIVDADDPAGLILIGTVESPPLVDIVEQMLLVSDDNTAEMLLKEIGVAGAGFGGRSAGLDVVERTLRSWDIPMANVRLADGSGLSADNAATCDMMVALLGREVGSDLDASLPVAARTGTLIDEFIGSPVAGRLRAKTGTLGNPPVEEPPLASKALAGYVDTSAPHPVEFALIINAPELTTDSYRRLWALIGDRLATYPEVAGAGILVPGAASTADPASAADQAGAAESDDDATQR